MNNNSMSGQEINVKDLMFTILRKWKLIVLFAVIFACLLGGYKGFSTYKNSTNTEAIEEAEKKYNEELLEYEESTVNLEKEISNIITDIEEQEEYLDKSIWLKVSPYDICEARADVYVTTDYTIMPGMNYQNVDYAETILQVYQSLLTSNEVKETLALKAGTEPKYLNELLTISRSGRIITIKVDHINREEAQAVLDDAIAWVNSLKPQVVATIGEHTISVVNSSTSSRVDLSHMDTQEKQEQKLVDLKASLEAKQKELSELEEPKLDEFNNKSIIKPMIKFAVIGGVLGAGLVVMVVCVIFAATETVYSAKELKNRYGVKVLGALPTKEYKCPIDRLLNRLEGRVFEEDEVVRNGLLAQNVRNAMGEVKKLLVLGTADCVHVEAVAKALEAELPEIKVIAGGNLLKDVNTLKKLPECDCVVLVEACGVSKYGDIALEIEKANDLGKSVVGCVVIG